MEASRWKLASLLERLIAPVLLDEWLVAADAFMELGSPMGFWLAARLGSIQAPPGSSEREILEHEAHRLQRVPAGYEGAFSELALPQQLLLGLSACGELASILDTIAARGASELAFAILATLNHCHVDELAEQHALVARFLRTMLADIEAGVLTVVAECEGPPNRHVGYLTYRISNGWSLSVYNRVYEWHYLSGFTSPAGLELDFTTFTLPSALAELMEYEPPPYVLARVYRF